MKLPIGIDDFNEIVTENYSFVDKSLFIKDIIDDGSKVLLITRPRRFGKTINMSMLECFLNIYKKNSTLFNNLKITAHKDLCKSHQNQHPVIFVTFKNLGVNNYEKLENGIKSLFKDLYLEHKDALYNSLSKEEQNLYNEIASEQANYINTQKALIYLSQFYEKVFNKKTFILIDEYDTPVHSAYNNNFYNDAVSLVRGILGTALKGNNSLRKGILTGITKIASESIFSGLNNLDVYSVMDPEFGEYFGFSEIEVSSLVKESRLDIKPDNIKAWYNGYKIEDYILYNPWSIMNCLKRKGRLQAYWINTSQNTIVERLLNKSSVNIKYKLEHLLQNKPINQFIENHLVFPNLDKKEETIWTLLLYSGYLKVISWEQKGSGFMAKVAIPNKEVSIIYEELISTWFTLALNLESYEDFTNSLITGNIDRFKALLQCYISESGSYFDFNKQTSEQVFHSFILGLVVGLKQDYFIKSNIESGFGRFDVALVPKDKKLNGILIEFKVAKKSQELKDKAQGALKQIKDKKYTNIFKEHGIDKANLIGLAFCGKELDLAFEELNV